MDPSCRFPDAQALPSKLQKLVTLDPAPPISTVLAVHRKMRDGRSAYFVHAADGCDYVLKLPDVDRPCSLFREALGSLLGAEFGLPMATWAALSLGSPTVDYTGYLTKRLPNSGFLLGFGSRIPEQSSTVYEYLPDNWIRRTELARQIVRMQVFDAWVMNGARRQYVGYRNESGELQIRFIANGSILATGIELRVNPYETALRLGVDLEQASGMIDQINGALRITLERLTRIIPDCWMTRPEVERSLAILQAGQHGLLNLQKAWLRKGVTRRKTHDSFVGTTINVESTNRPWIRFSGSS